MVGQHPHVLRPEEEKRGREGRLGHPGLAGGTELAKVVDQAECHGPPCRAVVCRVDEVLAIVWRRGEVLE